MPITYASNANREKSRSFVLDYLKKKKAENPGFTVLDIGGSANSWADSVVDGYVDMLEAKSHKPTFVGDINEAKPWKAIQEKYGKVDFILCTHTLEDIRNPVFAIKMLQESAKAGYISTPNKYSELSHVESHYFTGWSHHRWIFGLEQKGDDWLVKFIPKYASSNFFSHYNHSPWVKIKRALHLTNKDKTRPSPNLPAVKKNKAIANLKNELGFVWEDSFKFEFTDFYLSTEAILKDLKDFTEKGL